jgi:hypothetical protein
MFALGIQQLYMVPQSCNNTDNQQEMFERSMNEGVDKCFCMWLKYVFHGIVLISTTPSCHCYDIPLQGRFQLYTAFSTEVLLFWASVWFKRSAIPSLLLVQPFACAKAAPTTVVQLPPGF